MKHLWSVFLVMLFVDWLRCSSASKDPGSRRRKNRLRTGLTTTTRTIEFPDLLDGSTVSTTAASTLFSSYRIQDVSKDEQAEQHPDEITSTLERMEVFQFSDLTAVKESGREVTSTSLNQGISMTNSSLPRKPSENNFKGNTKRKSLVLSSSTLSLPLSASSSASSDVSSTNENASTTNTIPTTTIAISTSTASFRTIVPRAVTVATQQCPPENGGDCVSSSIASSRGTASVYAATNFHPASSASRSGLTQQPTLSFRSAGVGDGPVARRAVCAPCDVRQCQPVFPESCQGLIRKDSCSCCPVCSSYEDSGEWMVTTSIGGGGGGAGGSNVCDSIRCPRGRVCLLNIQGLPMCRCPSVLQCRRLPERPVCSTNGRTFKNRCFLSVEECTTARIRSIAHDGRCDAELLMTTSTSLQQQQQQQQQQSIPTPHSPAFRLHLQPPKILMSDERVRHQGHRVRDRIEHNRRRFHRGQTPTGNHERKPTADGATSDKRQSNVHAKGKSQGQRNSV